MDELKEYEALLAEVLAGVEEASEAELQAIGLECDAEDLEE